MGTPDVKIHPTGSYCWVDWIHAEGTMWYSIYNMGPESWGAVEFEPYSASGGYSEPMARAMARVRIRNPVPQP